MRSTLLLPLFLAILAPTGVAQESTTAEAAFAKGEAARARGNFEDAVVSYRKATELDPDNGRAWHMLGYCLHGAGKLDEALKIHLKATGFVSVAPVATYNVACVYSLQNDKDRAFEWLGKAAALGFNDRGQLEGDTDMDNIRDDPRFTRFLESMTSQLQVFQIKTERECARLAYFGANGSPGQIAIDYGPVAWQPGYDEKIDDPEFKGKHWRLGSDFWTRLDNSMPIEIGGVEIPVGNWYLTVVNKGDRKFALGVHDPKEIRRQKLDAFRSDLLKGGLEIPLQHEASSEVQEHLQISIKVPPSDARHGVFAIRFGGHALTAEVSIGIDEGH